MKRSTIVCGQRAAALIKSGLSVEKAVDLAGISRSSFRLYLQSKPAPGDCADVIIPRRLSTADRAKRALELIADGVTRTDAARSAGLSLPTLRTYEKAQFGTQKMLDMREKTRELRRLKSIEKDAAVFDPIIEELKNSSLTAICARHGVFVEDYIAYTLKVRRNQAKTQAEPSEIAVKKAPPGKSPIPDAPRYAPAAAFCPALAGKTNANWWGGL